MSCNLSCDILGPIPVVQAKVKVSTCTANDARVPRDIRVPKMRKIYSAYRMSRAGNHTVASTRAGSTTTGLYARIGVYATIVILT
jgi:hypothetical protein